MNIYILLFLIMSMCAGFSCSARADIIYLKNGREVEGKIIREDEEKIWVITFGGTKIGIEKDDIKTIVPKDFVVEERPNEQAQSAEGKKPGKTTYGTMTAEVAYTKDKHSTSQGSSTDEFNIGGSGFTLNKYRDGKKIVFRREAYKTGALQSEVRLEDGLRQGNFRSFYENGTLKETGFYVNDQKEGVFKEYWPNGKLKSEVQYAAGLEDGRGRFYHENASLAREVVYVAGKKDGIEKSYYDNGQLESSQLYINGRPIGFREEYYPSGALKAKVSIAEGTTIEYFKDGRIKSKLLGLEDQYIEYDQDGNTLYTGPIPEDKKADEKTDEPQVGQGQ